MFVVGIAETHAHGVEEITADFELAVHIGALLLHFDLDRFIAMTLLFVFMLFVLVLLVLFVPVLLVFFLAMVMFGARTRRKAIVAFVVADRHADSPPVTNPCKTAAEGVGFSLCVRNAVIEIDQGQSFLGFLGMPLLEFLLISLGLLLAQFG